VLCLFEQASTSTVTLCSMCLENLFGAYSLPLQVPKESLCTARNLILDTPAPVPSNRHKRQSRRATPSSVTDGRRYAVLALYRRGFTKTLVAAAADSPQTSNSSTLWRNTAMTPLAQPSSTE